MTRTVWIEFLEPGESPITLTQVESIHINNPFLIVDYQKSKSNEIQSNYYPVSRIRRIHETMTREGK
mgnify:CR=1 FL=1